MLNPLLFKEKDSNFDLYLPALLYCLEMSKTSENQAVKSFVNGCYIY